MSNEAIVFLGTPKTLESSGGSIASLAVVQATVADYSIIADGANYPDAEFVLTATFSVAPVENTKLALYGLYKQATEGDVTGKRPGFTNPVGRAKYDAWAAVEGTSAEDAEADYIAKVRALLAAEK